MRLCGGLCGSAMGGMARGFPLPRSRMWVVGCGRSRSRSMGVAMGTRMGMEIVMAMVVTMVVAGKRVSGG